ncbi:MAG: hypothetical protein ACP5P6_11450, partial [Candidatus Saccharicenans sp.]
MAEYDRYGVCLREYVYIGAKMVADYRPDKVNSQTGRYYYRTTGQIGSTRIVTDDLANVVYASAYDPYMEVQQKKEDIQQNLDDSLNSEPKI